jgi:hypothetical protein
MNEWLMTCDTSEDEQDIALYGCRDSLLASCRNGEEMLSKREEERKRRLRQSGITLFLSCPYALHRFAQGLHCPS